MLTTMTVKYLMKYIRYFPDSQNNTFKLTIVLPNIMSSPTVGESNQSVIQWAYALCMVTQLTRIMTTSKLGLITSWCCNKQQGQWGDGASVVICRDFESLFQDF